MSRTITIALIQNFTHRVNNRLVVDIRRRSNGWLFSCARQLIRIDKLSSLGHSFRKIISCGMESQILLKFNICDSIDELASQKRICLGRLNVYFGPSLPMQYSQILLEKGERLSVLLSPNVKTAHGPFWLIYMSKTSGQSLPN